jgi:hypothetical protein
MNRYLCTTDERAADDEFVGPRILRLTLPINPFPNEPSSQRSVASKWPSIPEKNSAYGVFLTGSRIIWPGGCLRSSVQKKDRDCGDNTQRDEDEERDPHANRNAVGKRVTTGWHSHESREPFIEFHGFQSLGRA